MNQFNKLKLNIYMHYFFDDFIFIYPFYSIMFQDNGISGSLYSVLMVIWVISVFIFEIPSGIIADKYNRKTVIIYGEFIRIIGYLSWIIFPNFYGYAFGFICWGIKSALRSGALEALIYDNLIELKKEELYSTIISKAKFLSLSSIIIVTLLSAYLIKFGYSNLVYLSVISLLLSIISLKNIKDIRISKVTVDIKNIFLNGYKYILSSNKVIYLVFIGQALYIMGMLDEYYGLVSYEMGFTKSEVALIIVGLTVIEAIFMLFVPVFNKVKKVYFIIIFGGLLFSISLRLTPLIAIIALATVNSLFKAFQTVIDIRFQDEFKGDIRATVTSFKGFLDEIFCASFYALIGIVSAYNSYIDTFYIIGLITSVIGIILLILRKILTEYPKQYSKIN